MLQTFKSVLGKILFVISRQILSFFDFSVSLSSANTEFPELAKNEMELIRQIQTKGLTMTSHESMCVLAACCKYVNNAGIEGDFVETGVWRGGSSILAAAMLGDTRKYFLFDTFAGMPKPGPEDFRVGQTDSSSTQAKWETLSTGSGSNWVRSSISQVKKNFSEFELETRKLNFVAGMIEETLEIVEIEGISILRIDTDFYSSTKIALVKLWPKLNPGGVLILDDYAHWDGARRAVDEYFDKSILMLPIPNSGGRVIVK